MILAYESFAHHQMAARAKENETETKTATWASRTTWIGSTALVLVAIVVCISQTRGTPRSLFGSAPVIIQEAYQSKSTELSFDHSTFGALLQKHVNEDGWVDYKGLNKDAPSLDAYIELIAAAPFAEFDHDEKLAFLLNAYNAFTLRLILDYYPIKSIKDIPSEKRWDAKRWNIGKRKLSLNQIEHEEIRPKFAEPRIHFALVCAAIGCPPLRNKAYVADQLEKQLEDQTRRVHANERWFRYKPDINTVHLTKLYDWYGSDFKQVAGSVLNFAARYVQPLKAAIDKKKNPKIKWLDYDWALNDKP